MSLFKSIFSVSGLASTLMVVYLGVAGYQLYKMMFPLSSIDMSSVSKSDLVHPLWDNALHSGVMDMRVFLSTRKKFHVNFLLTEFPIVEDEEDGDHDNTGSSTVSRRQPKPPDDVALLWKQEIRAPSLSKSFLITTASDGNDDNNKEADPSFQAAKIWLDNAERTALERGEGGVFSAINAAGQGIESTSFLLTAYYAASKQFQKLLALLKLGPPVDDVDDDHAFLEDLKLDRTTVHLPASSPLWNSLKSNSTLYLHVMVMRRFPSSQWDHIWPPKTARDATQAVHLASSNNGLLLGQVDMIKFDQPHHISKPTRILYYDISYIVRRYLLGKKDERPPWDFSYSKPREYAIYESYLDMKRRHAGYPYWKPEVSIKYVQDEDSYPIHAAHMSGMPLVRLPHRTPDHPTGIAHLPALYSSEIGLTSDKFIPVNTTVTTLPLRVSFDRSDFHHDTNTYDEDTKKYRQSKVTTATAGAISPARWRLLAHLTEALEAQKNLGFEASDIDEVKNLIADTNLTLLAITMLASALHLLFEFLTFKSEVNFWRENKDLTGLSVRSLFFDFFGQTIILLYLIERESSLLMVGPSAIGCLIAFWKCRRASGLMFVKFDKTYNQQSHPSWWNKIFRLVGYELRATRLETKQESRQDEAKDDTENKKTLKQDLTALTLESDRIATRTLGVVMGPIVLAYIIYSLVKVEHNGWYSWLVTSASSAVYALGFVLMTPQLFLNWKLKSVAHLPWQVLIYRSLNTFIDDLFSFIVRMPTMARISCFRDDVVFIIYLYQRWLYPVDKSRPVEGGGGPLEKSPSNDQNILEETKKKQ